MNQKTFFLCCLVLFQVYHVYPVVKGSESALSVESFCVFPSADNDNTMLGFGWMKNGFALEDNATTCTYDSVFQVGGQVYLNGGSLYLSSDLLLRRGASWCTSGKVYGNNYILDLGPTVTSLGSTTHWQTFDNCRINLHDDLLITGSVKFQGTCELSGHGGRVTLEDDGYILIGDGATLTCHAVYFDEIKPAKINFLSDSSKLVMVDSIWEQDGNYTFTQGSLSFKNQVDFVGSYTFAYESVNTSTIEHTSEWRIGREMRLRLGKNNGVEPLYFASNTSRLHLDNCTLASNADGFTLKKGEVCCHHEVKLDIASTDSSNAIKLGDGTSENDLLLTFESGSSVHLLRGNLFYNVTNPNGVVSRSDSCRLIRYANTEFYMNQDIELLDFSIVDRNTTAALVMADGKVATYNSTIVEWPGVGAEITGTRYNYYTVLLDGDDELCLRKGTFNLAVRAQNSGNSIYGCGCLTGAITLQDADAELGLKILGDVSENITLNGGTVTLLKDLSFNGNHTFAGSGNVDLAAHRLSLGELDQGWTSSIYWDANSATIEMNSSISLAETWTFSGTCIIKGNWNVIDLGSLGNIVVERGSTVLFKEVKLKSLSGNQIRCLDDAGMVRFYNCKTMLDGTYSFTVGNLDILESFEVHGTFTLDYQSTQPLNVGLCAALKMMEGSTLSYNPQNTNRDLFVLEYPYSTIELNSATLHSTATGVRLTNGILSISGDSYLASDATVQSEGIIFGDGVSVDNDLEIVPAANSNVELISGHVWDRNVENQA